MENVLSVCQDIMLTQMENANLYLLGVKLLMWMENAQNVNLDSIWTIIVNVYLNTVRKLIMLENAHNVFLDII